MKHERMWMWNLSEHENKIRLTPYADKNDENAVSIVSNEVWEWNEKQYDEDVDMLCEMICWDIS